MSWLIFILVSICFQYVILKLVSYFYRKSKHAHRLGIVAATSVIKFMIGICHCLDTDPNVCMWELVQKSDTTKSNSSFRYLHVSVYFFESLFRIKILSLLSLHHFCACFMMAYICIWSQKFVLLLKIFWVPGLVPGDLLGELSLICHLYRHTIFEPYKRYIWYTVLLSRVCQWAVLFWYIFLKYQVLPKWIYMFGLVFLVGEVIELVTIRKACNSRGNRCIVYVILEKVSQV